MARGPKPQPAAIKKQRGNPGKRRMGVDPVLKDAVAIAAAAAPGVAPPVWLKADALAVWSRLAPRVARLRLLTPTDAETFGRYCRNFSRWLKMQDVLDTDGETYVSESAHGTLKRLNPAALYALRLDRELSSAEANFGLNPAERQRIFAAKSASGKDDPADDGLFGGQDLGSKSKAPAKPKEPSARPATGYLN